KAVMTNDDEPIKEYMTYEPVNASKSGNKTGKEKRNVSIEWMMILLWIEAIIRRAVM
ncbi:17782_t:CDS:1, partial [Racocetra persica]